MKRSFSFFLSICLLELPPLADVGLDERVRGGVVEALRRRVPGEPGVQRVPEAEVFDLDAEPVEPRGEMAREKRADVCARPSLKMPPLRVVFKARLVDERDVRPLAANALPSPLSCSPF